MSDEPERVFSITGAAISPGWSLNKRTQTDGFVCLTGEQFSFVCPVHLNAQVQVAEKTIDRRSISDLPQTMNADPDMPRQALLACYDGTH